MYNEKKESKEFENEVKQFEYKYSTYQNEIARQLVGDLGNEIKETLRNPMRITRFQLFKTNMKNLIKRIVDVL